MAGMIKNWERMKELHDISRTNGIAGLKGVRGTKGISGTKGWYVTKKEEEKIKIWI